MMTAPTTGTTRDGAPETFWSALSTSLEAQILRYAAVIHLRTPSSNGGYMAPGTRGRDMQEGRDRIRIYGQDVPVRAHRASISAISGHADRSELLRWLKDLPAPKRTFLTHGELASANALADTLRADRGWDVVVPKMGAEFPLV